MTDPIRDEARKASFEYAENDGCDWASNHFYGTGPYKLNEDPREPGRIGFEAGYIAAVSRRTADHAELIAEAKTLAIGGEWIYRNGKRTHVAQIVRELVAALEAVSRRGADHAELNAGDAVTAITDLLLDRLGPYGGPPRMRSRRRRERKELAEEILTVIHAEIPTTENEEKK